MRVRDEETYRKKKEEIMEKCYAHYAEYGLFSVGIKSVAKACGYTPASLYTYFTDLDDMIVQSTEYCMSRVEDDFMAKAPKDPDDVIRFIEEIPYWTAREHGKKYRLMYQVYTHPKYREHGKKFFEGVNKRYTAYARLLEDRIGISHELMVPLIFIFIRACVHYALFEDEFYLKTQLQVLKKGIGLFMEKAGTDTQK